MRRLIVLGVLLLAALWWLGRALRRSGTARTGTAGPARHVPETGGAMVRDRVCNTFVTRERALTAPGEGGETLYFCSERCRDAWRSSR